MQDNAQNTTGALPGAGANLADLIHLMHTTGDAGQREQLQQQVAELGKSKLALFGPLQSAKAIRRVAITCKKGVARVNQNAACQIRILTNSIFLDP